MTEFEALEPRLLLAGTETFLPDASGYIVFEAEHFITNTPGADGHTWTLTADALASGGAALQSVPDSGANQDTNYAAMSPRLDFRVNFAQAGTYIVWVRGKAVAGNEGASDSVHVGLDGQELASSDRLSSFNSSWGWSKSTMDGPAATLAVTEPGGHVINVWMREDGLYVDKLVLTTDAAYTPAGAGPAECARGNGAPLARGEAYAVDLHEALAVGAAAGVLANDTDVDGDALAAVLVAGPAAGDLALGADGSFTYTPGPGFTGTDRFTYRAWDGADASQTVTVQLGGDVATGLLAHYTFDEGAGTTAADSSGHGCDAQLVAGASWATGRIGGAAAFDGSDDAVEDDDAENYLNGLAALTIALWVKSDVVGTDSGFIAGCDPEGNDTIISFRYDADGASGGAVRLIKIGLGTTAGVIQLESSSNVQTTQWQHLAFTWASGQTLKLYVNGQLNTPTALSAAVSATMTGVTKLLVGKGQKVVPSWDGLLDDVRIYDRALTAADLEILANTPPVAGAEAYAVGAWHTLTVAAARGVLANDADPDGNALRAVLVTGPAHGTVALGADGSFTYTPEGGFLGTDTFTYAATDGHADSGPATASIFVAVRPDVPPAAGSGSSDAAAPGPPAPAAGAPGTEGPGSLAPPASAPPPAAVPEVDSGQAAPPAKTAAGSSSAAPGSEATAAELPPPAAEKVAVEPKPAPMEPPAVDVLAEAAPALAPGPSVAGVRAGAGAATIGPSALASRPSSASVDRAIGSAVSRALAAVARESPLWQRLDKIQEEVSEALAQKARFQAVTVGTAVGMSAALSAGYIVWTVRGGSLLLSAAAAMPMWRWVDPLPVLEFWEKKAYEKRRSRRRRPDDPAETDERKLGFLVDGSGLGRSAATKGGKGP